LHSALNGLGGSHGITAAKDPAASNPTTAITALRDCGHRRTTRVEIMLSAISPIERGLMRGSWDKRQKSTALNVDDVGWRANA